MPAIRQIRALETFDTAAVAQGAIASERTARIYACAPRERWSLGAASCAMAYESPMIVANLTVNMDAAASLAAVLHRGVPNRRSQRNHSRSEERRVRNEC